MASLLAGVGQLSQLAKLWTWQHLLDRRHTCDFIAQL